MRSLLLLFLLVCLGALVASEGISFDMSRISPETTHITFTVKTEEPTVLPRPGDRLTLTIDGQGLLLRSVHEVFKYTTWNSTEEDMSTAVNSVKIVNNAITSTFPFSDVWPLQHSMATIKYFAKVDGITDTSTAVTFTYITNDGDMYAQTLPLSSRSYPSIASKVDFKYNTKTYDELTRKLPFYLSTSALNYDLPQGLIVSLSEPLFWSGAPQCTINGLPVTVLVTPQDLHITSPLPQGQTVDLQCPDLYIHSKDFYSFIEPQPYLITAAITSSDKPAVADGFLPLVKDKFADNSHYIIVTCLVIAAAAVAVAVVLSRRRASRHHQAIYNDIDLGMNTDTGTGTSTGRGTGSNGSLTISRNGGHGTGKGAGMGAYGALA